MGAHGFSRRVALKKLGFREYPQKLEEQRATRRFFDEAQIAARLHHGGIASVLDYGIVDGEPFMVIELVDGLNAGALLARSGKLPVDVALIITLEVAHALAYAHRVEDDAGRPLGITHRDVKPSNILVSRTGDVKLTDFGIAFATHERLSKTTTGMMPGTPNYMPPEQLLGSAIDGRADVFSLGCTLHAFLTGTSPLAGLRPTDLFEEGEIALAPEIAPDVAAIIRRAVQKNPNARYATASEMAADLGKALAPRQTLDSRSRLVSWLADGLRGHASELARPIAPQTLMLKGAHKDGRVFTLSPQLAHDTDRDRSSFREGASLGSKTKLVFFLAVAGVLVVGAAIGGILVRARLTPRSVSVNAPTSSAPPPSATADELDAGDAWVDAKPDSAAGPDEPTSSAKPPRRLATPVPNGCLCLPTGPNVRDQQSLCHPAALHPPTCDCVSARTNTSLLFAPCHDPETPCVTRRSAPSSTHSGESCTGYRKQNQEGGVLWESGIEEAGHLECHRCAERRSFPRHHGERCKGINAGTGELMDGVIECH